MEIGKIGNSAFTFTKKEDNVQEIKEHLKKTSAPEEVISEREQLTIEQTREIIGNANEFFNLTHTQLQFQLHEDLEKYFVSVVDADTKEVIREIPPEKMLDLYAAMREVVGLMIDKKL